MVNVNAFDVLCAAIERYNEYITRRKGAHLSYEEKRGLFYNFLRNLLGSVGNYRKAWCSLLVKDLNCSFYEDGTIVSILIDKRFGYDSWSENGSWTADMLNALRDATTRLPVVYPTRELNEMALIINSL